jgi:hypothetical protein
MADILFMSALAFATVMTAMLLLTALCEGMRRLGAMAARRAAPAEQGDADAVDPRILAVIAAAVTEAIGRPIRIHRVRADRGAAERWSRAGRLDIMISHRVGPSR